MKTKWELTSDRHEGQQNCTNTCRLVGHEMHTHCTFSPKTVSDHHLMEMFLICMEIRVHVAAGTNSTREQYSAEDIEDLFKQAGGHLPLGLGRYGLSICTICNPPTILCMICYSPTTPKDVAGGFVFLDDVVFRCHATADNGMQGLQALISCIVLREWLPILPHSQDFAQVHTCKHQCGVTADPTWPIEWSRAINKAHILASIYVSLAREVFCLLIYLFIRPVAQISCQQVYHCRAGKSLKCTVCLSLPSMGLAPRSMASKKSALAHLSQAQQLAFDNH